jgi:hypothetical protein
MPLETDSFIFLATPFLISLSLSHMSFSSLLISISLLAVASPIFPPSCIPPPVTYSTSKSILWSCSYLLGRSIEGLVSNDPDKFFKVYLRGTMIEDWTSYSGPDWSAPAFFFFLEEGKRDFNLSERRLRESTVNVEVVHA